MSKERHHADTMKSRGFIIDNSCYPWVAYKGPRGQPTELYWCYTTLESELIRERERRHRYARAALASQDRNLREFYSDNLGEPYERPETD